MFKQQQELLAQVELAASQESSLRTLESCFHTETVHHEATCTLPVIDCLPTKRLSTGEGLFKKHKFGLIKKPQGQGQFRNGAFVHRDHGATPDLKDNKEVAEKLDQSLLLHQTLVKSFMQQYQYSVAQIESLKQVVKSLQY